MPTNLTYTYATEADIQGLLSVDGTTARVDDDGTGAQSATEAGYITQAIQYATDRCNFYLLGRYAAARLQQSWIVNNWCVIVAAHWLSMRRGNPPPGSVKALYEEAIEDMKLVQKGAQEVPGIGARGSQWPVWSNVRVEALYSLRKLRVEVQLSEGTQLPERKNPDFGAERIWEPL